MTLVMHTMRHSDFLFVIEESKTNNSALVEPDPDLRKKMLNQVSVKPVINHSDY